MAHELSPEKVMAAEAAARAAGGKILSSTGPAVSSENPDPETLMRLGTQRILELQRTLAFAEQQLNNCAGIIAGLVTVLVENVEDWKKDESGAMCVKIMPEMVKRAEGSMLRFTPTTDPETEEEAMNVVVVLKEDQETFKTAEEAAQKTAAAGGLAEALK